MGISWLVLIYAYLAYQLWNASVFIMFFLKQPEKEKWIIPTIYGWLISIFFPPPLFFRVLYSPDSQTDRILNTALRSNFHKLYFTGDFMPTTPLVARDSDEATLELSKTLRKALG